MSATFLKLGKATKQILPITSRAALALALAGLVSTAHAATTFIKADNTTALNLAGSYTANSGTPTSADTIQVDSTLTATRSAAIGGNISVGQINQLANTAQQLTISSTAASTLNIYGLGSPLVGISVNASGGNKPILLNCAVGLQASQKWTIASPSSIQIGTTFSLAENGNALTISGTGNLDLRPNTLTLDSGVTISCSSVNVNAASADVIFGGANSFTSLLINTGTAEGSSFPSDTLAGTTSNFGNANSGQITLGGNATSGTLIYNGNTASTPKTFTMDVRNSGSDNIKVSTSGQTLTLSAANLLYAGTAQASHWNFGGAGNLNINSVIPNDSTFAIGVTKNDAGTLTLSGANTYTGSTVINAGAIKLSAGSLGNTAISFGGTGTFAVQPGSATTINIGSTATASAGATLSLGANTFDMTDGAVSTCNIQHGTGFSTTQLTTSSGATFKFNLGNSSADLLAVANAAAISGTMNVTIDTTGATSLTTGTYNIITAASGLTTGSRTWQFSGGGTSQHVTVGAQSII